MSSTRQVSLPFTREFDDVLEDPDAWRDEEVLQDLFIERGWEDKRIAAHFDAINHRETVTRERVKHQRRKHDIISFRSQRSPTSGLAKKLWDMDPDDLLGGESA